MALAPNKMEIKREMLSVYQLKIADLYNISIANVKNLVPSFFDKEKYVTYYQNLQRYLRLSLKFKKNILHQNSIKARIFVGIMTRNRNVL